MIRFDDECGSGLELYIPFIICLCVELKRSWSVGCRTKRRIKRIKEMERQKETKREEVGKLNRSGKRNEMNDERRRRRRRMRKTNWE